MFEKVKADLQRYFQLEIQTQNPGFLEKCYVILTNPSLHAVLLYRYQNWLHLKSPIPFLRKLGLILIKPVTFWFTSVRGILIDSRAKIGKGFYIGHPVGVIIGPVEIGNNCNIGHYVTIGVGGRGDKRGIPRLGNQVWVGSMSVLFGKIEICDHSTIMPGTVLSKSVPAHSTVGGNPGRILMRNTNNHEIVFGTQHQPKNLSEKKANIP